MGTLRILIIGLLLLSPALLRGTAQILEKLIMDGKEYDLAAEPLESYNSDKSA